MNLILIPTTAAWFGFLAATAELPDIPAWMQTARELGSFGLVAFLVWYYTTRVAPKNQENFISAMHQQRGDYLAAQKEQRMDYITARAEDRLELRRLAAAIEQLNEKLK